MVVSDSCEKGWYIELFTDCVHVVCSPSPEDEEARSHETESFKGTEESEESERSELLYGVDDSPSWILSVVLGFQVRLIWPQCHGFEFHIWSSTDVY